MINDHDNKMMSIQNIPWVIAMGIFSHNLFQLETMRGPLITKDTDAIIKL